MSKGAVENWQEWASKFDAHELASKTGLDEGKVREYLAGSAVSLSSEEVRALNEATLANAAMFREAAGRWVG